MQYGYRSVEDLRSGLSHYMDDHGYNSLEEMVGKASPNIIPAEELDRTYIVYPKINPDKCVHCGRCYISCYDGGHQAISFDSKTRKVKINEDRCVGCHLCANVCPASAIGFGRIEFKKGKKAHDIKL